jgi:hypothetical protein
MNCKKLEALKLWNDFSNVPINEEDLIELHFIHFEKGTNRFEIWQYFETNFDLSITNDLQK